MGVLPPLPGPFEGVTDSGELEPWIQIRFIESSLPGHVTCLSCACPVVEGEQMRHWSAIHKALRI